MNMKKQALLGACFFDWMDYYDKKCKFLSNQIVSCQWWKSKDNRSPFFDWIRQKLCIGIEVMQGL